MTVTGDVKHHCKREPLLVWIGMVGPLVVLLTGSLNLDPAVHGAANAVAPALSAFLASFLLDDGRAPVRLLGLAQAVIALAISIGVALDAGQQAGIMAIVGVFAAAITRSQVTTTERPRNETASLELRCGESYQLTPQCSKGDPQPVAS
jgi:hypothetical protein